uniref:Phosphatidylserine decarboxylase proenzyme 3-like isoform X3 n=1 Tax=Rhizophora mucronata TaxID=61149 RepID=A0A2P2M6S0_RHIMU
MHEFLLSMIKAAIIINIFLVSEYVSGNFFVFFWYHHQLTILSELLCLFYSGHILAELLFSPFDIVNDKPTLLNFSTSVICLCIV